MNIYYIYYILYILQYDECLGFHSQFPQLTSKV